MMDEIKISTRKVSEDYIWFTPDSIDEKWRGKYKSTFFNPNKDINFFVEITQNEYKVFFDKINSNRTDKEGRTIYSVVMACGQRGSDSSKAVFKLFKFYFLRGGEIVRELFNREFTENFIESVYDKAQTVEVKKQMNEKLSLIISELEEVEFEHEDISKDNSYLFMDFETGLNGFLTLLELITNSEPVNGSLSLVLTSKPINEERLQGFDHTIFSRGLCLTTGSIAGGKVIEKTIKELPPKPIVPEPIHEESEKGNPFPIGGTPPSTTEKKEPQEEDFVSKISSNPILKRFLILLAVIILTLILAVRSCWKKSGENSPSKSSSTKEQKLSQDSLKNSTKSNDTLKVKFDK